MDTSELEAVDRVVHDLAGMRAVTGRLLGELPGPSP